MRFQNQHKWILIISACLIGVFIISFKKKAHFDQESTSINQSKSYSVPKCLYTFTHKPREIWQPYSGKMDLFDYKESVVDPLEPSLNGNSDQLDESVINTTTLQIQLNGWAQIKEKILFIFSSLIDDAIFLGSIGDSFENPCFSILSFDFKIIENNSHKYSIPLVTILDKQNNNRVILTLAMYNEYLNGIQ